MSIIRCSFCDKRQHEVKKLIAGPSVFICDECLELCFEIVSEGTLGDREYASWFTKPNTFLIDRVTDLYKVPADKRRRCWEEVFACLHAFEDEDARRGARLCGVEWTDDDLPAMRLTVNDDTVATATLEP